MTLNRAAPEMPRAVTQPLLLLLLLVRSETSGPIKIGNLAGRCAYPLFSNADGRTSTRQPDTDSECTQFTD
jgi:hypothetical protein